MRRVVLIVYTCYQKMARALRHDEALMNTSAEMNGYHRCPSLAINITLHWRLVSAAPPRDASEGEPLR